MYQNHKVLAVSNTEQLIWCVTHPTVSVSHCTNISFTRVTMKENKRFYLFTDGGDHVHTSSCRSQSFPNTQGACSTDSGTSLDLSGCSRFGFSWKHMCWAFPSITKPTTSSFESDTRAKSFRAPLWLPELILDAGSSQSQTQVVQIFVYTWFSKSKYFRAVWLRLLSWRQITGQRIRGNNNVQMFASPADEASGEKNTFLRHRKLILSKATY